MILKTEAIKRLRSISLQKPFLKASEDECERLIEENLAHYTKALKILPKVKVKGPVERLYKKYVTIKCKIQYEKFTVLAVVYDES